VFYGHFANHHLTVLNSMQCVTQAPKNAKCAAQAEAEDAVSGVELVCHVDWIIVGGFGMSVRDAATTVHRGSINNNGH
jgi:hypothetical protein